MKSPQLGERWQYRDEFILEIDRIESGWNGAYFEGRVIQILPGTYRQLGPPAWIGSGKSSGYTEHMENWILLEGQHKPTQDR
jgi:hypothetical protein